MENIVVNIPDNPKIYHITHVRNLPQILDEGVLWSDAKRIEKKLYCDVVGMSHIKQRRLNEIVVSCHGGTFVGDYVPFYFCPRSIMLYILYMGNHPDLEYNEGQRPIIHLQADLHTVIQWAEHKQRRWAFSDRNAGNFLTQFFNDLDQLAEVNWQAVASTDFRDIVIKDGKQAEFLIHESFPWELVEEIDVYCDSIATQVAKIVENMDHCPNVTVKRSWYY